MSTKSQTLLVSKRVPIRHPKRPVRITSPKKSSIQRVGETNNFIINYDSTEGLILLYGKNASTSHKAKLGLNNVEAAAVIKHLEQAKLLFNQ
jgi:hypothetical protein